MVIVKAWTHLKQSMCVQLNMLFSTSLTHHVSLKLLLQKTWYRIDYERCFSNFVQSYTAPTAWTAYYLVANEINICCAHVQCETGH